MSDNNPEPGLKEAIQLINAGYADEAREYLVALLKKNPKTEAAWLWLAETTSTEEERISVIRQGLNHIPDSVQLNTALNVLDSPEPYTPKTEPFLPDFDDTPSTIELPASNSQPFVDETMDELDNEESSPKEPWMEEINRSIDPNLEALFSEVISEDEFEELKKEKPRTFDDPLPPDTPASRARERRRRKPRRKLSRAGVIAIALALITVLCIGGGLIFRTVNPTGFANSLQSVLAFLPDDTVISLQETVTDTPELTDTISPIVVAVGTETSTSMPSATPEPTQTEEPEVNLTATEVSQNDSRTATSQANLPVLSDFSWERIRLDHFYSEAWDVQAADLDNDGDIDVVSSARKAGHLSVYANDGSNNFIKTIIDADLGGATKLKLIDLDQDGDLDILASGSYVDELAWYSNNGSGVFIKTVIAYINFPSGLDVYDIDADGDYDVFATELNYNQILWFENDGNQNFTEILIDEFETPAHLIVHDLDQDGDGDILVTGNLSNIIAWWQNDGEQDFTYIPIDEDVYSARYIDVADLDGDGDTDIIGGAGWGTEMYWWENMGEGVSFLRHNVDSNYSGSRDVTAIDLDRDGDLDLVSCADGEENKVVWWRNNGEQIFTRELIEEGFQGAKHIAVIDIDRDGNLDVVGTAMFTGEVIWFRNTSNSD